MSRYQRGIDALRDAVLSTPGDADPALRRRVYGGQAVDEPLEAYVRQIATAAYKIQDEDIERLLDAGYTEDAIFELTLAAALKECTRRFDKGQESLA